MGLQYNKALRGMLLFGLLVLPFTELRFGVFGVGELAILACFFLQLIANDFRLNSVSFLSPVINFWLLFFISIVLGFVFNVLFLGHSSGTYWGAFFDFSAYLLVFILVIIFSDKNIYCKSDPICFFVIWYSFVSIIFIFLYVLSFFCDNFLGLPLKYHDYFAPLVENVHQASMLTCTLPFLGLSIYRFCDGKLFKLFIVFSVVSYMSMAMNSGSTKALMAIAFGSFLYVFLSLYYYLNRKLRRLVAVLFFIAIITVLPFFAVEYGEIVVDTAISSFDQADPVGARRFLYTHAIYHGFDSFLFGYGPGQHINYSGDSFSDCHMTFLTAFIQGGFFGFLGLCIFTVQLVRRCFISPGLLACAGAISIYALGGDVLRRLPIWVVIISIFAVSYKLKNNSVRVEE